MKKPADRVVEPEWLDELPPHDPRALRSRRDLQRLNQWMNHPRMMARLLAKILSVRNPPRIAELGAGDGHFLFNFARHLKPQCPRAEVILVDRLDTVDVNTRKSFDDLGWSVRVEMVDVFEWLRQSPPGSVDAIVCNLFLHHFQAEELAKMFQLVARAAKVFVTLEPRRTWLPSLCGHLLWCIRCGPVTRHDAGISIRAGFSGHELSALWPDGNQWELTERSAGLFSHLFVARRKE